MKTLFQWLRDYVDPGVSPQELVQPLTLAGVSVDTVGPAENGAGTLIELEITTNRPDLLSHYGLAREIAALYSKPLKPVNPAPAETTEPASSAATVDIADPDLCHRYVALVLRNLRVQPGPDWMRQRLEACGIQSINNIVDASNYVLLELGHPTHAFDLDTLAEKRIVIRRAQPGEKLVTLDGVTRPLRPQHLLIADARRPVALAGIMGGAETEISFQTKNVLLESAWFDPLVTRRAAKELGLRTEASYRFERGMDVEAPLKAALRCAELFLELAGGELLAGAIDVYPRPWQAPNIRLCQSEIVRVLGMPIPAAEIERILTALGFRGTRAGPELWQVASPSWRRDVSREIDLIEELARHFGYDKFPARLPPARQPVRRQPYAQEEAAVRTALEAQGYDETINFSLVNPQEAEEFLAAGEALAPVQNPLSEESSALRPSGLLSLTKALAWNVNRGQRHLRLYEIGKAYALQGRQFRERPVLTLAGTGLLREKSVHQREEPFDLFALKGTVEAVLEPFQLPGTVFRPCDVGCFHPAQRAAVLAGEQRLGVLGRLSPQLANRFKLRQEAYLVELDLEALYAAGLRPRRYQALSRFPAVARDFSLLLDQQLSFGSVREAIETLNIPEVVSVSAVDRFQGGPVPTGRYSLLVRVIFQSRQYTLKDEQVQAHSERIVKALQTTLGASLRA